MHTYTQDPRTIITPDAFSVDPPPLGTPLVPPLRRAVALFIDVIGLNSDEQTTDTLGDP